MYTIGDIIKKVRTIKGLTLQQVVDQIDGYDPTSLSRVERGMQGASNERLAQIAKALGVTMGDLYTQLDSMNGIKRKPLPITLVNGKLDYNHTYVKVRYMDRITLPEGKMLAVDQLAEDAKDTTELLETTMKHVGVDPNNTICTKMPDDTMTPVIPEGSLLAIDTSQHDITNGKTYLINHRGTVRVAVLYSLPGGGVRIKFHNELTYPEERYNDIDEAGILLLGRVFWYSTTI